MKKSSIGFIISIISLIVILSLMQQCSKNVHKKEEYKGILVEDFIDSEDRSRYTYKIQTSQGYVNLTVGLYPDSYNYIEPGDSIIKRKNQLNITIKKKKYEFNRMSVFYYK